MPEPAATESRFEREYARDLRVLRALNVATFSWSLATVVVLLTLVIPMRRTSVWLILLSVYALATRLSVFVARAALRVPRFVEHVDDADPAVAGIARTVFDRHRDQILAPLLGPRFERKGAAATYDEIGNLARARNIAGRRRAGLVLVVIWVFVTIATIWIVIATGGGPPG